MKIQQELTGGPQGRGVHVLPEGTDVSIACLIPVCLFISLPTHL